MKTTERTEIIAETSGYCLADAAFSGVEKTLANCAVEIALCVKILQERGVLVTNIQWVNKLDRETNPDRTIGHFEVRGEKNKSV